MLDDTDPGLLRQLRGERLVLAEITYRFPDHQALLQTFVWQEYDLVPKLPKFCDFLEYWIDNLDGPLHSIRFNIPDLILVPNTVVQQIKHRFNL